MKNFDFSYTFFVETILKKFPPPSRTTFFYVGFSSFFIWTPGIMTDLTFYHFLVKLNLHYNKSAASFIPSFIFSRPHHWIHRFNLFDLHPQVTMWNHIILELHFNSYILPLSFQILASFFPIFFQKYCSASDVAAL